MAKEYNSLPSDLLHIKDPFTAWCLNDAVYSWGTHVEATLKEAVKDAKNDKEAKSKHTLAWNKLFGDEAAEGSAEAKRFKDPLSVMRK